MSPNAGARPPAAHFLSLTLCVVGRKTKGKKKKLGKSSILGFACYTKVVQRFLARTWPGRPCILPELLVWARLGLLTKITTSPPPFPAAYCPHHTSAILWCWPPRFRPPLVPVDFSRHSFSTTDFLSSPRSLPRQPLPTRVDPAHYRPVVWKGTPPSAVLALILSLT
jgi:hypothetical protein